MTVFDTPDGDIHVEHHGPRDAAALVLIHGSASSTRSWQAMAPALAESQHVISVDLLGHGRSSKPDDGDYATEAQARRIGEVVDRLGVERAIAVGHSSGGYTATALAELRPELVGGIALLNTGPRLDALIVSDSAAIAPTQWPPSDDQIRQFASAGFHDGFEVPQDVLAEVRLMTLHSIGATMRASTAYLRKQTLPARLAAVGKPLLVVFGDADRGWDSASAADYHAVSGARIEMLSGIGHSPLLEDPIRTAVLVNEFAANLRSY